MLSKSAARYLRAIAPFVVLVTALVVVARTAHADNVGALIDQLENSSSDKVRLAAAVNLAKLEDQKAVLPLAKAVLNDSDKSVRGACAVALSKVVNSHTKPAFKNLALANLKRAAADDSSSFVRQQASRAIAAISGSSESQHGGGSQGGGSAGGGGAGIYVNVGPMSSKTGSSSDAKFRALMVKTTEKTLARVARRMSTSWSGGTPSKAVLAQKHVSGFYIDGTLNTLTVKEAGSSAMVSCKVSMLLADFPDKSVFGFLNGGASVQASGSKHDQELAAQDCVSAVIEDLIAKKIVPTICMKTTSSCP